MELKFIMESYFHETTNFVSKKINKSILFRHPFLTLDTTVNLFVYNELGYNELGYNELGYNELGYSEQLFIKHFYLSQIYIYYTNLPGYNEPR